MSVSSVLSRDAAEWLMQQEAEGRFSVPPEHFATTVASNGQILMDPLTTIDFRNGRNARMLIQSNPETKELFRKYVAKLLKSNTVMHLAADQAKQAGRGVNLSLLGCRTMPNQGKHIVGEQLLAASSSDHTGRKNHTRHTIRYPSLARKKSTLPLRQLMKFLNEEGGLPKRHSIGAGRASNPEAAEAFVAMMASESQTVPMTAFVVNNVATLETKVPACKFKADELKENRTIATSSNKFPGTAIKLPTRPGTEIVVPPNILGLNVVSVSVAKVTPELFSSPPANESDNMPAPRRRTRSRSKHRSNKPLARAANSEERVRAILPGVIGAESLVHSVETLIKLAVAPYAP